MIKINYTKLETCRSQLQALLPETYQDPKPLTQSKGEFNDADIEIIKLLLQIYNEDLPALIKNSDKLLAAISESFQDADETAQSSFEE